MITIIIVILTVLISIACFKKPDLFEKLDFSPYEVRVHKQWYRFVSHAFVHADWVHLIVNMLVFYSFGSFVEKGIFGELENNNYVFSGEVFFLILYIGGIIIASVSTYLKHNKNPNYVSVGASGAVSAVLFISIFFSPMDMVYFFGIIPIPGFVFGILYLAYSTYMGRSSRDNINHDAHIWGAVFGLIFPLLIDPSLIRVFINHFSL